MLRLFDCQPAWRAAKKAGTAGPDRGEEGLPGPAASARWGGGALRHRGEDRAGGRYGSAGSDTGAPASSSVSVVGPPTFR